MDQSVIVAGCGIGGLSTSIALARKGYSVRTIERAKEIKAIGYGIQLGPNAFHAFSRLGIEDAVLAKCSLPEEGRLLDAVTGETLLNLPMGSAMTDRYGKPYAVIHRRDLHEILTNASIENGVELIPGCPLNGFDDTGSGVRVQTGQSEMVAAALVAADGIWSETRTTLTGAEPPEKLGYVAFRAVVPMSEVDPKLTPNAVMLWCGPGYHMIHYPLRSGELFNVVAAFDYRFAGDEQLPLEERLFKRFEGACGPVRSLLSLIELHRHWEIYSLAPISTWSKGRITLSGDSAHAMMQAMAQGACQSIEDALVLADRMSSSGGDVEAAFKAFNTSRLMRVARVQYMSRFMWELIHARGAYADLRRQRLAEYRGKDTLEALNWLYETEIDPAVL